MRLTNATLAAVATLSPFAGSGAVIVTAGWIETLTGYDFAEKSVAVFSVLVAIASAVVAALVVIELVIERREK